MNRYLAILLLLAGAALTAGCRATVVFPTMNLNNTGPTLRVSGDLFEPDGPGPHPAVVLLHSCGGLGEPQLDWAAELAKSGYVVLAVDTFGSRGAIRCPVDFNGSYQMMLDAYGALDYLAGLPKVDGTRIGVIGFSLGGNAIDRFAVQNLRSPGGRQFRAAVNMYGRCTTLAEEVVYGSGQTSIPTMVIIGDQENPRRLQACQALVGKLPAVTVHILEGVYHAFDNPWFTSIRTDYYGNPMLYDAAAHTKAEKLVSAYFARQLKK